MAEELSLFVRRAQELARRADSWYTFSDFLSPGEQEILLRTPLAAPVTLWGGAESCERRMAAFGREADFGLQPEFPIACLQLSPKSAKYAEALTHRDILGSVLGLGLDRRNVGDIFLREEDSFIFVAAHLAPFVCENLTRVRHTDILCQPVSPDAEELQPRTTEKNIVMASRRADAALCAVFRLSRAEGAEKFSRGLVFRNSLPLSSPSAELKDGDILSLRGYGRFRLEGICGETGKGRLHARISLYG